jgi:diguanylate cyclase (GGDEF)-like protein/PAS domain S-box-containing protein
VRFYAGVPMTASDGQVLGTVCVLDVVPRELDPAELDLLRSLARQAVRLLELRHQASTLQQEKHFHDAVLAASPDVIFLVDPRTNRTVWSSAGVVDLLGWTEEQLREFGETALLSLVHPEDRVRVLAANSAVQDLGQGEVLQVRHRSLHASGAYRWLSRRVTPFTRDEAGRVTEILGVTRDVTDSVEAEQRLREAALHDPLTGLANRVLLADRLAGALARNTRTGHQLAVLFVDLDGFKSVNDSGGHAAGDAVLLATAERLQAALRTEDSVARVGGDEFVILLEPTAVPHHFGEGEQVDVRADALSIAERVKVALSQPFSYAGRSYSMSASIGVCIAEPGSTPDGVLHDADIAMYRAKSSGKDRHELFVAGMTAGDVARVPLQGLPSVLSD